MAGLSIFNQRLREFEFRPGPVFANVVLVDEINRAMPQTQSSLLEAMAERQVTVDGVTRPLVEPFIVMATQNPIEYEGTFPLPEAQLDRFFVRTTLGYPDAEDENRIVDEQLEGHPLSRLEPTVDVADVATMSAAVREVFVHEAVRADSRARACGNCRLEMVAIGSSVRGSLALNRAARGVVDAERPQVRDAGGRRAAVRSRADAHLLFRPSFVAEIRDRGWKRPPPRSSSAASSSAEAGLRHRPRRPGHGGVALVPAVRVVD